MPTQTPGMATQQEAYQALLAAGATQSVAQVLAAVTRPESSGYTAATNNYQGNQFLGLWQIGSFHGFDNARLRSDDIAYQAQAALKVYQEQGFGAWETYTNGAYKQYLNPQNDIALALAHSNQLTMSGIAGAVGAAAGQGASEGAQQAVAQPILAATPNPIAAPDSSIVAPPTAGQTAIDGPGQPLSDGSANPIDGPGGQTASGNPIDGPVGFDKSIAPSGI